MWILSLSVSVAATAAIAAEASFGFTAPITPSFFGSQTRRSGEGAATPSFRANFYPTLKLGSHWFAYGAVQVHSALYFDEELGSRVREIKAILLQAYVGYSRIANGRALTVKVGQLTSAFGSFPLRYDDARNWLIRLTPKLRLLLHAGICLRYAGRRSGCDAR